MSPTSVAVALAVSLLNLPTASFADTKKDDSDSKSATVGLPFSTNLTEVDCYRQISIDDLIAHYEDWQMWKALQEDSKNVLASCKEAGGVGITATDKNPVLLTLVREDKTYSWLVPQADDYGQSLKGVESLRVVVLTVPDAKVYTPFQITVTSTKVENPLVSQIPDFVKAVASQTIEKGNVATHNLHIESVAGAAKPTFTAWASQVIPLPFERATVAEDGVMYAAGSGGKKGEKVCDIKATYNNVPWAHWGLTGTAGVLIGRIRGPEKMKVDNGKYAADPLSRAVTMAAVAYYPWSFDTTSPEMTLRERVSVLAGGVLTPAPGFGLAVSGGIIRGLAINAGWAWMWVPTSDNGGSAGSVVPATGPQLSNKRISAFFLGGGYVFSSK